MDAKNGKIKILDESDLPQPPKIEQPKKTIKKTVKKPLTGLGLSNSVLVDMFKKINQIIESKIQSIDKNKVKAQVVEIFKKGINVENFKKAKELIESYVKGGNVKQQEEAQQDILDFDVRYAKQPVATLRNLLEEHSRSLNKDIPNIKKLKKQELIDELRRLKFDPNNLPPIVKREENILKRYSTKPFNNEEQQEFMRMGPYRVHDPLKSKAPYINPKTQREETTELQPHQKKFISKWILGNFQGAIVYHGVGTGKTISAVVAAHYYLSVYPKHKVIVVSPPALVYNFIAGLLQYGMNIRDNRFSFYTYDKFIKVVDKIVNDKTLIIVDEAHNLRTQIIAQEFEDKQGKEIITVSQNKRGFYTLRACKKCHKALLLTGTPFVNKLYDIENLISMVDKKNPLTQNNFAEITTSMDGQGKDYFKYRISHFENPKESEFFPKAITRFVPLVMKEEDETYKETEKAKNPFYVNTRKLTEQIDALKVDYVINTIKKSKGKSIIYTTFIDSSLQLYINALSKENISYGVISGKEDKQKKEDARVAYNKGEIQVLLISAAGTAGVDTIATARIFIVEPSWNEGSIEQAAARAIRFKSHYHLPKDEQKVEVLRLLVCKPNDVALVEDINKAIKSGKPLDYSDIMLKIRKADAEAKELSKGIFDEQGNLDMKKVRKLPAELKQKAFKGTKFSRYDVDNALSDIFKDLPAVDVRLCIMSLAKQQVIDDFVKIIDENVPSIEDFKSPLEEKVQKALDDNEPAEFIVKLQQEELNKQYNTVISAMDSPDSTLNKRLKKIQELARKQTEKISTVKRYQEFFTPDKIVKEMLKFSSLLKKSFTKLYCLEPTAGSGNLVRGLLEKFNNVHINMVEIQEKNRELLKSLVDMAPDLLNLEEEGDFLRYINNRVYNFIIMNPPYHLYKKYNPNLDRDYYDMDFVKKAFLMLDAGGELIALVRKENREKQQYADWLKTKKHSILDLIDQQWAASEEKGELSAISSINLSIIKITRTEEDTINEMNEDITKNMNPVQELEAKIQEKLDLPVSKVAEIVKEIQKDSKKEEVQDVEFLMKKEAPKALEDAGDIFDFDFKKPEKAPEIPNLDFLTEKPAPRRGRRTEEDSKRQEEDFKKRVEKEAQELEDSIKDIKNTIEKEKQKLDDSRKEYSKKYITTDGRKKLPYFILASEQEKKEAIAKQDKEMQVYREKMKKSEQFIKDFEERLQEQERQLESKKKFLSK